MTEPKFCKDCKWAVKSDYTSYSSNYDCHNPIHGHHVDLVTGITHKHTMNAQLARYMQSACGEQGAWWEPKSTPLAESTESKTYWQLLKTYFE